MLYLMSTTVVPAGAAGTCEVLPVTAACARELAQRHAFTSAVGHDSTAGIMSTLLGVPVEANRLTVAPEVDDRFLCFKLRQRPPEGAILDADTLEAIGYEWCIMHYSAPAEAGILDHYHFGSWEDFASHIRWSRPPQPAAL